MADEITIDGLEEHAFRRSIETMLRYGEADEAAGKLRDLLAPFAGNGGILPGRILEVSAADIELAGWDELAQRINEYDRPENRITALGIGIADPEDWGVSPDEDGRLTPPLETTYFTDAAYPFSEADRDDLLEGYSSFGCEWQGDFDHTDKVLTVEGIDDLYGAIADLENQVSQSASPSAQEIQAGAIGACYLGVLVFQATRDAVLNKGLPRPLTVLLVNSDAYPFFDAPVMSRDEYEVNGAFEAEAMPVREVYDDDDEMTEDTEESAGFASLGSLLGAPMQKAKKKPVLVLEGEEAHNPLGMEDEQVAMAAFEARALSGNDGFSSLDYSDTAFALPGGEDDGADGGWQDANPPQVEGGGALNGEHMFLDDGADDDVRSPQEEGAPRRKTPIDFGAAFEDASPIDFGAPLGGKPDSAEEPAAPKENWLDDWREITQGPYNSESDAAEAKPEEEPREAWLEDWRDITEPPGADADDTGKPEQVEAWLEDWREIAERPSATQSQFEADLETDDSAGPAREDDDSYDFHRLEEHVSARSEDFFDEAPIPGSAWQPSFPRPATHSIRDRIRATTQEEAEAQPRPGIWGRIVNLTKRFLRWITRS